MLAAGFSLHTVFLDAISRFEDIAISFILQLVDQLYNLFIQILFQLEKFLVHVHQFALAGILINISDDVERKVEDTLQVAGR